MFFSICTSRCSLPGARTRSSSTRSTGVQWPQKMTLRTTLALLLVFTLVLPAVAANKQVDDNVLYDAVKRKLANDQVVKGGALEVEVKGGVVTMKGSVEFDAQKARAE